MVGTFSNDACWRDGPQGQQARPGKPAGTGAVRVLGGMQMVDMIYPGNGCRPCSDTDSNGDGVWLLVVNLDGGGTFVSGDRVFALAAGDLLLVDRRLPLRREAPAGCHDVRVYLPGISGQPPFALPEPAEPCRIDGRDTIGGVVREVVRVLLFTEDRYCAREEEAVRDALLALVTSAYCARRDRCERRGREGGQETEAISEASWQWRLLAECVEARLADPALNPATIATMRGVSTRHLHRLFRQAGVSFGSFVRMRRLERCREDLADPRFDSLPLTEIAYRWGFSDSSHFSRCFRSAFGCTAREFRARQARAWPATPFARDDHRSTEPVHPATLSLSGAVLKRK